MTGKAVEAAQAGAGRRGGKPYRNRRKVSWPRRITLVGVAAAFLIPLLWMIVTSLKTQGQVFTYPPVIIPNPVKWANFATALFDDNFGRYLLNTIALSALVAAGNLVSATLVAYGLARIEWKRRNLAFIIVLSTLLLPDFVTLIPLYTVFRSMGMIGGIQGYLPLILPAFFGKAYFIFLMRQFMLGIPRELSEAARIDGCSEMRVLISIIMPLCKPAMLSLTLYSLIYTWSDFLQPLVYLRNQQYYTVSVGLAQLQGRYQTQWPEMMAAAAVTVIPILVVFAVAQKKFIRGISTTGIK